MALKERKDDSNAEVKKKKKGIIEKLLISHNFCLRERRNVARAVRFLPFKITCQLPFLREKGEIKMKRWKRRKGGKVGRGRK